MARRRAIVSALVGAMALAGCVTADVGPINSFVAEVGPGSPPFVPDAGDDGRTMVGLSFSGGGMRASAFAYGVLRELDGVVIDEEPYRRTLVDDVRMISGTSGGSVTAAYFGLKGPDGYQDFRERFLLQNAEERMHTRVSPRTLTRAWRGGANDRNSFAGWLDDNLFDGATFAQLKREDAPIVWITASDVFHGTPFLFTYDTFAALCSDLDQVRLADAVAASAAVPVVFTPHAVAANGPDCGYERPKWMQRALADDKSSLRLRAYARSLSDYNRSERLHHLRLLDGGLTDNNGLTGFTLERAAADTAHGPLSPAEAVNLQTMLYIVADAGREASPEWGLEERTPTLAKLMPAVSYTAVTSSMREGYDALSLEVRQWHETLIRYRCGLSATEVRRHRGGTDGWNCRDVKIVVEHLSFRNSDLAAQAHLNRIPTRLALTQQHADMAVQAGRDAVRGNPRIRAAIDRIQQRAAVKERY